MSARPNQEPGLAERHGLTRRDVDRWVWLVEPSGRRLHGAAAVARTLREMGGGWAVLGRLASLPGAGILYAGVARSRGLLSRAWGDPPAIGP